MNNASKLIDKNKLFYLIWLIVEVAVLILCYFCEKPAFNIYFALGSLFWGGWILLLFLFRANSPLNRETMTTISNQSKVIILIAMIGTVLFCVVPMSGAPLWNGEIPEHRNQFEVLAESMLNGHIYMDYDDVDPKLEELENPYDSTARDEAGVNYHWDHAYYNGHYYMYFGVVPVIILFLPYRIITGEALTTYHATQIFVAFFIVGMFLLFWQLAKKLFPQLSVGLYLVLSIAFSCVSVWYSVSFPALYCTAITAGICMEIWSLFFFSRAVYVECDEKKQVGFAVLGALFGALAFGCRPPVALGNLLAIPMLIAYLKDKKWNFQLVKKLILAALPYAVIGMLLMLYNYVRFDNPFEFGQAYQLTSADQQNYGNFMERFDWVREINCIISNFISFTPIEEIFPYVSYGGALVNFPIFLLSLFLFQEPVIRKLREKKIFNLALWLLLLPVLVTAVDAHWAPLLGERYRMDIYYLMAILCFLVIACWYCTLTEEGKIRFRGIICVMALFTLFSCFILIIVPYDMNMTQYFPGLIWKIKNALHFGRI